MTSDEARVLIRAYATKYGVRGAALKLGIGRTAVSGICRGDTRYSADRIRTKFLSYRCPILKTIISPFECADHRKRVVNGTIFSVHRDERCLLWQCDNCAIGAKLMVILEQKK